jgi:V8-like Glu-specific endopeptidase
VATAGHCVTDGEGAWADNWIFVPGYDAGRAPYGQFPARERRTVGKHGERAHSGTSLWTHRTHGRRGDQCGIHTTTVGDPGSISARRNGSLFNGGIDRAKLDSEDFLGRSSELR